MADGGLEIVGRFNRCHRSDPIQERCRNVGDLRHEQKRQRSIGDRFARSNAHSTILWHRQFDLERQGCTPRVLQFFSEAWIWYNRGDEDRLLGEPYENIIVLSDECFEEVTAQPIPTDLEAARGKAVSAS